LALRTICRLQLLGGHSQLRCQRGDLLADPRVRALPGLPCQLDPSQGIGELRIPWDRGARPRVVACPDNR
jgi:hypothetical protein